MEKWQIVQGLLLVLIALIGAGIAYGQYRNAAVKLQLDLFDRRYAIYEATGSILTAMSMRDTLTLDEYMTFMKAASGVNLLFGPKVDAYVREIKARAVTKVDMKVEKSFEIPILRSSQEQLNLVASEYLRRDAVFLPYLRIPHRIGL